MTRVHVSIDRLRRRPRPERGGKTAAGGAGCPSCGTHFRGEELVRNRRVCTTCGHHFPASARERLDFLADRGEWLELWPEMRATDPLQFRDLEPYTTRIAKAEAKGTSEALVVGKLEVRGVSCVAAAMDFGFLGGSMGSVVGEKLARACDRAAADGVPLITITASGGARMQEGILALMQMAKTVDGFETMADARLPIVVVLAHPTTGGVWASFASLGDVTYAEPGALIAFSGPRVIEQTTREKLPEDFGRAENQLANGQVDAVVDRRELPDRIGRVLNILDRGPRGMEPGPALAWAQERAERAARAAQSLPALSRRLADRLRKPEDEVEAP
jgi:acetyl-CoA carboxylase carboxyl transferase subunit beta